MKKIIYIALFFAMALGFTGCKKFLDVNDNPNNPTEETLKDPNLLLSSSLARMAAQTATSYAFSARWMGYWARSGTYGPNADEEAYRITTTFEAGEWATWLDIMFDLHKMEQKSIEKGGQDFYIATGKVLKTIGYMYLVDQYNNVPYSKAFQDIKTEFFPAYDKGQDIYNDLFIKLDEALVLFKGLTKVTDENKKFDILFGGDLTRWEQFINSQRLKLALRLVNVTGFNASAQMSKITDARFLETTAYVQPGYTQDQNQQNPYWDTYERLYDGSIADNFNRLNNYVKAKFENNNDPRIERFFSPNGGSGSTFTGFDYGELGSTIPGSASADVAGPALAKGPNQAQWLFTSVEVKFLEAEAITRGWLTSSKGKEEVFREAVTESFTWLGLTEGDASDYLNQDPSEDSDYDQLLKWPADQDGQIKIIGMQKYLALVGINNFEAWVDYRRIGVPTDTENFLSIHPSVEGNKIPLRLHYPQNEYNFNTNVVSAEGTINPQTSRIFWDVN